MKKYAMRTTAGLTVAAAVLLPIVTATNFAFAAPRGGAPSRSQPGRGAGQPARNGTNSSEASGSTRPARGAGADHIRLIEGALARTLTETEKSAVSAAATTYDTAQKTIFTNAEAAFAAAIGFTVEELRSAVKAYRPATRPSGPPNILTLLKGVLGRDLTTGETTAITAALATRDAALQAAVATYRSAVAAAVGKTVDELDAAIAAYLQTNGGGGRRGGQGGDCKPSGSGGTSSGGTSSGGTTGGGTTTGGTGTGYN